MAWRRIVHSFVVLAAGLGPVVAGEPGALSAGRQTWLVPGANPLRSIALTQLSATRERPLFSASRRPPPAVVAREPVVVAPPPRKREIAPPSLSLVGTIIGEEGGVGIFVDQTSKAPFRLWLGEDHDGWRLQRIDRREVTMEKEAVRAVLTLPQPGGASGEVRLLPVSARGVPVAEQH